MENPALQLLKRHGRHCPAGHPLDHYTGEIEERRKGAKHCGCPIFISGSLKGIPRKKSTKTSDWAAARLLLNAYAEAGDWSASITLASAPPPASAPARPAQNLLPLDEAIRRYMEDLKQTHSAEGTIRKYKTVLGQMKRFASGHGLLYLEDWTEPRWVREFRNSWEVSQLTSSKKMGNLKPFFEFFVEERALTFNPARIKIRRNRALRAGDESSTANQKRPFTDAEITRMIQGARETGRTELRRFPKKKEGRQVVPITEFRDYARQFSGQDLVDFIHFECHTGFRISDVVLFDIDQRLTAAGTIKLRTTKAGTWVEVRIPDWLIASLRERARLHGPMIFLRGGKSLNAKTDAWRKPLNRLWARLGPWEHKPTPHRFKHTFIRLLLDQMLVNPKLTLAAIATLAGTTEAVIRKHYSAWMPGQQEILAEIIDASFAKIPQLG
jgi:hypothetical protein